MIRVCISTVWAVFFTIVGLVVSAEGGPYVLRSPPHHGPRFGIIMAGLVLGLALFSALREAEILPGLGPKGVPGASPGASPGTSAGRPLIAFFIGFGWTLSLALIGIGVGYAVGHHLFPTRQPAASAAAAAGMLIGLVAVFPLYRLGWLAGLGAARGQWGIAQAILLFVGFAGVQGVGQGVCYGVTYLAHRVAAGSFTLGPAQFGTATALAIAGGYLSAAWWSVWYIRQAGPARLSDGGVSGIGWRPASRRAYLVAGGFLVVMIGLEVIVSHLAPPHGNEMIQQIFGTRGWKVAVLFVMAVGFAPAVEELVFRGGMFSALAGRCGTTGAAVITSLLFTVAHVQEYDQYWPGLVVILVVAAALIGLRLQYRSIRPGILLHVLFNAVGVLGFAFSR